MILKWATPGIEGRIIIAMWKAMKPHERALWSTPEWAYCSIKK